MKAFVGLLLLIGGLVVVLPALGVVAVVGMFDLVSGGTVAIPASSAGGAAVVSVPVGSAGSPAGAPSGVPAEQWSVILAAAQASACGVTASDLAAMAKVESGFGSNMSTSSAGAIGYGQFLPSTWSSVAPGGDPYDYHAALPAMARYLCSLGYGQDRTRALNAYGGCTTPNCLGNGSYAVAINRAASALEPVTTSVSGAVATALQWLGTPYAWGGNTPGVGLDCSGLVQQAFAAIGISLPRTSETQFTATQRVSADQVQPGDLVFFDTDGPGATHVGLVVSNGQMVDAPDVGLTVRTESYLTPFWRSHIVGFGRVA
jgi:cell wall-associated NlpC family hydrolase